MNSVNTTALVLARGGSKSIKCKNLRQLNGIPLISYVLFAAEECTYFTEIWVSTDCDSIEKSVRNMHPKAKIFRRSPKTSGDECASIDAVNEFLNFKKDVNIICLIQATSPCLHPKYLQDGYEMMTQNNYDSVFSVTRDHKLRWMKHQDGILQAINFDPSRRPRRQDWEGEMVESGHFYFTKCELIKSKRCFQNEMNSGFIEIPVEMCLEVDYEWQIPIAELLLKNHGYITGRAEPKL